MITQEKEIDTLYLSREIFNLQDTQITIIKSITQLTILMKQLLERIERLEK